MAPLTVAADVRFPAPGVEPTREQAAALVAALRAWFAGATDRVFALDAQCQGLGPDAPTDTKADIAAAFLAHQAIGARLTDLDAAPTPRAVAESCYRPVAAADGSPIAANLSDACELLHAVIGRAEGSLAATTGVVEGHLKLRASILADLQVAEKVATALGDQVRHVTQLRARADEVLNALTVGSDTTSAEQLAADVAAARATLERADADRQALLSAWAGVPARLEALRAREHAVRELRARCEEKIRPMPNLAVPSVDAIGPPADLAAIDAQPWAVVESSCRPYLHRLDRVDAALDEAERRFSQPLRDRDELRGLVQAFRDKAGELGLDEDEALAPTYRAAADLLWAAPCDMDRARELVDRYVAAVNERTAGETPRAKGGPT
jgi:hypothetical protein